MPYIKQSQREAIDPTLLALTDKILIEFEPDDLDGLLNYVITTIVALSLGPETTRWRYTDIARAVAVFECAKLEFYRRVAAPKEDDVRRTNGDLPEYQRAQYVYQHTT